MTPVIKLSVRGLAKYMTSSPSAQRRVLREYKYPDEDEPAAMRLYYKDASDRILAYHSNAHDRAWLRTKAAELAELARLTPGPAGTRLRHNARAVSAYEAGFGDRNFDVNRPLRLRHEVGNVRVTVSPELHVLEDGKAKIVKLDFSKEPPPTEYIKIVSQVMYEAARGHLAGLTSSSVLYLDVARATEHRGARAGSRTLRDIDAACASIEAIWPTI